MEQISFVPGICYESLRTCRIRDRSVLSQGFVMSCDTDKISSLPLNTEQKQGIRHSQSGPEVWVRQRVPAGGRFFKDWKPRRRGRSEVKES